MKSLNLIKRNINIMPVLVIGSFLRFFKLNELMQFIPDQGWFYLSARDMILTGNIPLVGLETSHPWIHHGALWTYVLGIILWIFNFDPVAPAYFIGGFGVVTIFVFYLAVKSMFGEQKALLGAIVFATAPLIVMNARIPYHTSPIPFFVILLFFATYKWVNGNVWFFPVIAFLLGILYNLEITTFVYFIAIGIILGYGFVKKERWFIPLNSSKGNLTGFRSLLNPKITLVSIISFLIPMIPFILYDVSHGYKQTLGFLVWVIYRVVKSPLSLIDKSLVSPSSGASTLPDFFSYYQQLIFALSSAVALIILFLTILFAARYIFLNARKKNPSSYVLLFLFLSVGLSGLFIHRVPIEADTLLISPFIIILTTLSIFWITRNNFVSGLFLVIIISGFNVFFLLSTDFLTKTSLGNKIIFSQKLKAVEKIIFLSKNKPYNIVGKGALSDFPVFTMPYEYLLWWKGKAPSKTKTDLEIVVWEKEGEIIVYEEK